MGLLTYFTPMNILLVVCLIMIISMIFVVIWRCIFQCNGYYMTDIIFKSRNLILQRVKKGKSKTLIIFGNDGNVSVDKANLITKHDFNFSIPKKQIKHLLKEQRKKTDYEIVCSYFPFECQGIDNSARELAEYLNQNYSDYKIILLGHTKAAIQFAQALNYLNRSAMDVKLILVSPAFGGVISYEEAMSVLNCIEKMVYRILFVPHKVDLDITKGSNFLNEIANFSKISVYDTYLIRSCVIYRPFNPINNYFFHLDNKLNIEGDGVVGLREQRCPDTKWKMSFTVKTYNRNSIFMAIQLLGNHSIL